MQTLLSRLFRIVNVLVSFGTNFDYPTADLPLDFHAGPNIRQSRSGFKDAPFRSGGNMPLPFVSTDVGNFEGYFMKVVSGRDIYAFEGIYYAEPPIRFHDPVPKNPFKGNISAKSVGHDCFQTHTGAVTPTFQNKLFIGKEDCLTCNIYSPEISSDGRYPDLPVIFFIFGGSFEMGAARDYGPSYLLEQDVILVGCNYRLGALGFLSTGDDVAPGNWGLKDLSLALDWTHKHIRNFGGDPNRIVVMGQSAGAVLSHLLFISPATKDKISGIILASGNAFTPWAVMDSKLARRMTRRFAVMNFCPINQGSTKMIDCLRRRNGLLLETTKNLVHVTERSIFQFSPVVEPFDVPSAMLTLTPEQYYAQGLVSKIPAIFSENSMDIDIVKMLLRFAGGRRGWSLIEPLVTAFMPRLLDYHHKGKNPKEITKKIREFYGESNGIEKSSPTEDGIFKAVQYRYFTGGWRKSMRLHSQIAPTFAYVFNYHTKRGYAGKLGFNPNEFGVPHNEDIFFIFNRTDIAPIDRKHQDFAVVKFFQNILTNFAMTGEPLYTSEDKVEQKMTEPITPPPSKTFKILAIENDEVKTVDVPWETNVTKFWDSLNIREFSSLRTYA